MPDIFIGIDLGGTNTKIAIVTRYKEILAKESRPTPAAAGPTAVLDFVHAFAQDLIEDADIDPHYLAAVGVGAPGPMNWQTGLVYTLTNFEGWTDVPMGHELQERFDGIPCFVENDANAACYGEFWLGAGQGCETIAVLTLGTGVGGGIVIDGELLRGIDGTAAEIGHLIVERGGRECGCGARGCLEAYASVPAMVRRAIEGLEHGSESRLRDVALADPAKVTGALISEYAAEGDGYCAEIIRDTAIWLGTGIAGVVNLINPEKVILCGGMIAAGDRLFDPIRETVAQMALDVPAARVEIVPAGLGPDAGVLGAAGCAISRL